MQGASLLPWRAPAIGKLVLRKVPVTDRVVQERRAERLQSVNSVQGRTAARWILHDGGHERTRQVDKVPASRTRTEAAVSTTWGRIRSRTTQYD